MVGGKWRVARKGTVFISPSCGYQGVKRESIINNNIDM